MIANAQYNNYEFLALTNALVIEQYYNRLYTSALNLGPRSFSCMNHQAVSPKWFMSRVSIALTTRYFSISRFIIIILLQIIFNYFVHLLLNRLKTGMLQNK